MKNLLKIFGVFLIVYFLVGTQTSFGQFFFFQHPLVNEKAENFELETLKGGKLNLSTYRGEGKAIVFFWAISCPHCRKEIKGLNAEQDIYKKKKIKLVLVNLGDSKQSVLEYFDREKYTLDSFLDVQTSLLDLYGIVGVPTYFLVNKDGIIKHVGHELPGDYEEILNTP